MRVFAVVPERILSGLAMLVLGVASCAPLGQVRGHDHPRLEESRGDDATGQDRTGASAAPGAGGVANRGALAPTVADDHGVAFDPRSDAAAGDAPNGYPLDVVSRTVPPAGRLRCDTSALVSYRGTSLRLQAPVRVHEAFIPYVQRFEELAREVAAQIYGRPPRSMAHAGAFNCRRIRGVDSVLSEHALGNAIDVRGFDFGSAARDQPVPEDVPGRFAHSFRVRVEDHWVARDARWRAHERFFAALRARLEADRDLFTVMLGPSYPGHRNHLHFDRAPFRFIQF